MRSCLWRPILLLVVVVANGQDATSTISLETEEILLKFFDRTGGLRWQNHDQWLQTADVCAYAGIECYNNTNANDNSLVGHVRAIRLPDNHLVGTLPSELFALPHLETLDLRDNDDLEISLEFVGANLQTLQISQTTTHSLKGLEQATSLRHLHVTNCQLGGPLPTEIGQLTFLTHLLANFNAFTGTIPESWSTNLHALEELYLYDNQLTGPLPQRWDAWQSSLTTLSLGLNAFTGTIPTELGLCTNLAILALQREIGRNDIGLRGPLPALDRLAALQELHLQHQQLTGTIPDNFLQATSPSSVIRVDLSHNRLTGGLPFGLLQKERLDLFLAGNQIQLDPATCPLLPTTWKNVADLGCDAFLCAPGTYAPAGRATTEDPCQTCPAATAWGTTECLVLPGSDPETGGVVDERKILVEFFKQVGGPYWKHSEHWLDPAESHCGWFGIECHSDSNSGGNESVTAIRLRNNDLTSSSTVSGRMLFQLPQLRVLDLSGNDVDVSLVNAGGATNLEEMDLSHSGLSSLEGIGGLANTKLRRLSIASNRLGGVLPDGVFGIATLEELDVSHNQFTGPLSASIGQLTKLKRLRIFGNRFNGNLPPQLGFLSELVELNAAENQFSGELPDTLNSLTRLETLILHQTTTANGGLTGALPAFDKLAQLTSIHLDGHKLQGSLPPDFLEETVRGNDPVEVHLSGNQFTGTVPSTWAPRFAQLSLDLTDNQITGFGPGVCDQTGWLDGAVDSFGCNGILCPAETFNVLGRQTSTNIPCQPCGRAKFMGTRSCGGAGEATGGDTTSSSVHDILRDFFDSMHGTSWANNSGWTVTPDVCEWYGIRCNAAGDVVEIRLEENLLSGTPPSSIFRLKSLRVLSLKSNTVSFSFTGIEEATSLTTLDLSKTGLASVNGIGQASNLEELHLTDNNLAGRFPSDLFSLRQLKFLFCNSNAIEGELPSGIGQLTKLKELYLFGNRISGQIPAAVGSLTDLTQLVLSENNFDGTLPLELNRLTNLSLLAIQREGGTDGSDVGNSDGTTRGPGRGLTGPLPAFDKLTKLKSLFLGSNSLSGSIPDNFLDGVADKSVQILVDLFHNDILGTVPASLARFDAITLYLSGNMISGISEGLCRNSDWMDGMVASFACDAILCPPNTSNMYGRRANSSPCEPCSDGESARYFGSLTCKDSAQQAVSEERRILEELYIACNGDNWLVRDHWMDDDVPICQWHGIDCSSSGSVESIHLMQNGLVGRIPSSLFSLPGLLELGLSFNSVDFTFQGISSAVKLEYLGISDTGMTSLAGIEQSPGIRVLHAEKNSLTTWPSEVFSLQNIEVLYLSRNTFSGPIPTTIGGLTRLSSLKCDDCKLTGGLPTSIGSLDQLSYLSLKQNALTGILPSSLGSLQLLKSIDISRQFSTTAQGLIGLLPAFQDSPLLTNVQLEENDLSGIIPDNFLASVDSSMQVRIGLGANTLTGTLPSTLGRFDNVEIDVHDNKIENISQAFCDLGWNLGDPPSCDSIACAVGTFNGLGRATPSQPCELCPNVADAPFVGSTSCGEDFEREILKNLYLALSGQRWARSEGWGSQEPVCSWYGISCYEGVMHDGRVKSINLSDNQVVGTVPEQIWFLAQLEFLDLSKNEVDLSVQSIGNAPRLKHLSLSETNFQSTAGIEQAASLLILELSSINLNGTFPDGLLTLTNLQKLSLENNRLTGPLPSQFETWFDMKELYLENNQLDGTLPNSLTMMRDIEVLSMGMNRWSGTLPTLLSSLTSLQIFSASSRLGGEDGVPGLSGMVPSFHNAPQIREVNIENQSLSGSIPANFLSLVKSDQQVKINLQHNNIRGSIPSVLGRFDDLRLLLSGNFINSVPQEICGKTDWFAGQLEFGCDALLCPPGSFNSDGRRTPTQECERCDFRGSSLFFGSTQCGDVLVNDWTPEEILAEVYEAAGGKIWKNNEKWLDSSVSSCDWYGVTCELNDEGKNVISKVELPENNLQGYIPSHIFFLPDLKVLNVGSNDISADLRGLVYSSSLTELYLDSTNVASMRGLSQATQLRVLKMDNSPFWGEELPEELFSLTDLQLLDLARCGFTGTISSKIGQLTSLTSLVLSHNEFSGNLPSGLFEMNRLESLILSENRFQGTLGVLLEIPSLQNLAISSRETDFTGVSGPLPPFSSFPNLRNLDLGGNSITGTIPASFLGGIVSSASKISVHLDSNFLHGTVPSELGDRLEFLSIDISNNRIDSIGNGLCEKASWQGGDVGKFSCDGLACPPRFFSQNGRQTSSWTCVECPGEEESMFFGQTSCPELEKAESKDILLSLYESTNGQNWINRDGWTSDEDVCDWFGISCDFKRETIDSITLGSNNLVGSVPTEIFSILGLKSLWIYSNPISVDFTGIGNAKTLTSLQLDSTGLESLSGIGRAPVLRDVDVRFNMLSGGLPEADLDNLTSLEVLLCDGNRLSGTIPSFHRNRRLSTLRLSHNNFHGPLPLLDIHTRLHTLDVSQNQLTGTIPPQMLVRVDTVTPIFVDVSDNSLVGSLPSSLSRFSDAIFYGRDNFLTGIHPTLCDMTLWNGGDLETFGCDGLLCPPGTGAALGRASKEDGPCTPCGDSEYYGSSCGANTGGSGVVLLPLQYATFTFGACFLLLLHTSLSSFS